jgi:glycosyltransferase involved in cell wall biosynthesis
MRVVYVSTLSRSGPLSHLLQLAPAVAAGGADVRVVCADEEVKSWFEALGIRTVAAPVSHKLDLLGASALWPALADADIVHTHDRRAGLFGRLVGRARGASVVHTLHGLPEEIVPQLGAADAPPPPDVTRARLAWIVGGVLRAERVLARLGRVVAPSAAMARFLVGHGFAADRVEVIPYGIEPQRVRESAAPDAPLVVGTAANLEYWKGIDVLIEAAALARAPVRLEIFGRGSLRDELEQLARDRSVDARFNGFEPDVRSRLPSLHVFALPSRGDNLPVSILEAMSSGLPVVGTRVGGIPELVVDGQTGLLVDVDDPAGLARALDRLAADPVLRRQLGRRGAERADAEFSAEGVASRMLALYERACASCT